MEFIPTGIQKGDLPLVNCFCVLNPKCQSQATIGMISAADSSYYRFTYVPGWFQGCQPMESLLLSTLQYLYAESDYFPILSYSLRMNVIYSLIDVPPSFNLQLLVYNSTVSRFPPNTSISKITSEMMVEQWNPSLSYQRFYEACAPIYCSYSRTIHKETFIGIIIQLISTIGGIVVSLRILTPHVVKLILSFSRKPNRNPNETEQSNSFVC